MGKLIVSKNGCHSTLSPNRLQSELIYHSKGKVSWANVFTRDCQYIKQENIVDDGCDGWEYCKNNYPNKVAQQAISATPAESLQAFENEVIEKCAKVAQDSELGYLAMKIRALKEVK